MASLRFENWGGVVLQGDVESIASKSPKDLTELFEKIAGSDELKDAYDTLGTIMLHASYFMRWARLPRGQGCHA